MPKNNPDPEPPQTKSRGLAEVLDVISALLGENGCPWDRKQTPETLGDYIVEEAFELVEAIRDNRPHDVMEELGDVFFLLLFVAVLYEKSGHFSLDEVFSNNALKMIRRHPHVFGSLELKSREELFQNWERIKREEKAEQDGENADHGLYGSLPKGLSPMLKAYRIHSKAARVGFTWESDEGLEEQLRKEWEEWREALSSGDAKKQEEEFGDYIFTLVELGRRKGIKANAALDLANLKFLRRFKEMEALVKERGLDLADMSLEEMDKLWEEVKK
ncbi:MAG: nucleoside triphosphate pyrophosphohydrolase [Thermodesulfobacteriota bacterium]|nr:nucleoside triphosphate pyrophosphohydrolase [Thermodesulfobacteriota bacterium]